VVPLNASAATVALNLAPKSQQVKPPTSGGGSVYAKFTSVLANFSFSEITFFPHKDPNDTS